MCGQCEQEAIVAIGLLPLVIFWFKYHAKTMWQNIKQMFENLPLRRSQ